MSTMVDMSTDTKFFITDTSYKRDSQIIKEDLAWLKEKSYEHECRFLASGIFGRFVRRGQDYTDDLGIQLHNAVAAGQISEQDLAEVLATDLLWGGKLHKDGTDISLVIEIAWYAKTVDVEQAAYRAGVLRKIGILTLGVVAGTEWDATALAQAKAQAIVTVTGRLVDGESWEMAIAQL